MNTNTRQNQKTKLTEVAIFLLGVLLAFAPVSCGYFNDEVKEQRAAQLSEGSECLEGFLDTQIAYFETRTSRTEAHNAIECLKDNLETANQIFRGADAEKALTALEATQLANGTVLSERPVPASLISNALIIKSWFLGGSPSTISTQDIETIIELLTQYQVFLLNIEPVLPAINIAPGVGNEADLRNAQQQFIGHFKTLLSNLPPTIDPFDMKVVRNFFTDLTVYTRSADYSNYLNLLHGMIFIINGQDKVVNVMKTGEAFMIFFFEYQLYNYKFPEFGLGTLIDTEYYSWLYNTSVTIGNAIDEDLSIFNEGWSYIYTFITNQ